MGVSGGEGAPDEGDEWELDWLGVGGGGGWVELSKSNSNSISSASNGAGYGCWLRCCCRW